MSDVEGLSGRELDAAVAEEVMGESRWRIYEDPGGPDEHVSDPHIVPEYSTDMAAAWQVVERVRESFTNADGFIVEVPGRGQVGAAVVLWHSDGRCRPQHGWSRADTAPEAICRAALAAVRASPPPEKPSSDPPQTPGDAA